MLQSIITLKIFYNRFKKYNPIAFFFGGFTWDSLTLKRIDQILDNFILLVYLLALGGLIILVALVDNGRIRKPLMLKYREWYPLGLQFFLGGLFSAYVVFYFKSASFTKTALFLGLLVLLLIANEFLEKRLKNIFLLISLYFMASFSYFIFFVPVALKKMNVWTFILSGGLSLILLSAILILFYKKNIFPNVKHLYTSAGLVLSLYLLLNIFYWQNWIPPVPLSLKQGGIYHHVSRKSESDLYTLKYEKPKWYRFYRKYDNPFRYVQGDTVTCFTAVFAPTKLTKKIYHHWQQFFPNRDEWLTTDRLGYEITGYRDGGYRGYTRKLHVSPGKWRVDVETEEGVLLGRIKFEIEGVEKRVPLKTVYR
ncbi:MAG: DUF2914 domain-containing protein [bacterium]